MQASSDLSSNVYATLGPGDCCSKATLQATSTMLAGFLNIVSLPTAEHALLFH